MQDNHNSFPPATPEHDGIDRRGMLQCMAWVGTGLVWNMTGGIATSQVLGQTKAANSSLTFAQISDSHLGFRKSPYDDVAATLKQSIARINALTDPPAFLLHTGDLTHLAKPDEFDAVAQLLQDVKCPVMYVPGEHDFDGDGNKEYLKRYGKNTKGTGWYSFDQNGVHFVGLVNVANAKSGSGDGGLGVIGTEQLKWLAKDLAGQQDSTPIILFAHVPLWMVYDKWGWGTRDSEQVMKLLKRFGSVTVLNGHIHQTLQKVEGKITFHTARSTAFPQSEPGKGSPGPMRDLAAERLKFVLGLTSVTYVEHRSPLAIVDTTLQ